MRAFAFAALAALLVGAAALETFTVPSFILESMQEHETIRALPTNCKQPAKDLTDPKTQGAFSDASGGSDYQPNLVECYKILPANPDNQRVTLTFPSVDIETGYDFIRVIDLANEQLLHDNAAANAQFYSTKGFFVQFVTDHSVQKSGWSATWTLESKAGITAEETGVVRFVKENHAAHKTAYYATDGNIIARRGLPITLAFNPSTVVPKSWRFNLLKSIKAQNVLATYEIRACPGSHDFIACARTPDGKFTFTFAANAPIGVYDIDAVLENGQIAGDSDLIYLLFNPWNAADDTYNADTKFVQEYVVRATGSVFAAENPRPWNFGVGDMKVLQASFEVLSQLTVDERRAAWRVAREFSWKANNDILHGRWDGNYADGKSPSFWQGSDVIIKQWYDSGVRVKYGQCWVFSGVTQSLSRSVGIGCRSVTNMGSAHEKRSNARPWDKKCGSYWVKKGSSYTRAETPAGEPADSIWNFHVWNEGWFTRPDIKKPAAWNAYDGTCQEESDGRCQMGPAHIPTVHAANKGNTLDPTKFDGIFLQGETDCEVTNFVLNEQTKKWDVLNVDKCSVGINTWTLKPGTDTGRSDVSSGYKDDSTCKSGSFLELGIEKADDFSIIGARRSVLAVEQSFSFGVRGPPGVAYTGKVVITAVDYRSNNAIEGIAPIELPLVQPQGGEASAKVSVDQLALRRTSTFRVDWIVTSKGRPPFLRTRAFTVVPPAITGRLADMSVGQEAQATLEWTNPLPVPAKCELSYSVSGSGRGYKKYAVNVGAKGKMTQTVPVKCGLPGRQTVSVSMNCDVLSDIAGEVSFNVAPGKVSAMDRAGRVGKSGLHKFGPQRASKPKQLVAGPGRQRRRNRPASQKTGVAGSKPPKRPKMNKAQVVDAARRQGVLIPQGLTPEPWMVQQ